MSGVLAAAWLVASFGGALYLVAPAVRRTSLGIVHPAIPWLGLEAVFFGIGSGVLAVVDGQSGPAWYVGAAVLAFGAGVAVSDAVARKRTTVGSPGHGGNPTRTAVAPQAGRVVSPIEETGVRRFAPAAIAVVAVGFIAPILVRSGIPFLTVNITGARAELVGLPVQLMRIALPALAIGWWFAFDRGRFAGRSGGLSRVLQAVPLIGVVVLAIFSVALASRYLVAELVAAVVIAWLLAGRRIPVRPAAAILIVGLVAFVGIGIIRAYGQAQGQEGAFALERTTSRIVLVQPRTLEALMEVIPAEQPYFLGTTWIHRLGPLLGRPDAANINLGYWIYPRVVSGPQDTAGYAAPGLMGEAWANLGPVGILLFALLGIAAERLGVLIAWRRGRLVDVAAGALAVLFLARTHALGLGGLAVLGVLVVAWRVVAGPLGGADGIARDLLTVIRWREPARA